MKVTPVNSPHQIIPSGNNHTSSAKDTRAAVVAKIEAMRGIMPAPGAHAQPPQSPVHNQNAVSVEELGAIQTPPQIDSMTSSESQETAPPEATTPEATPETPAEKTQVDPALSRQFAQLARQEKALRAQAQAIKAKETALAAREAELAAKTAPQAPDMTNYIDKNRFKTDPLSVLEETGLSYDELTQQLINRQPTDPRVTSTIQRLEAKIASLEEQNKTAQKSQVESQQQAYNAAVKQIKMDAISLVKSDPSFETIKATGSIDDVVELITETYNKDGILLTVEDAAQQVEDYLVEEYTKLAKIDKIQKRLQAANSNKQPATTVKQTQPPKTQTQPQTMKTLTNNTSSSRKLTAKERAILAFKGEKF